MATFDQLLDDVTAGYLEGAAWADAPEGSSARFTVAARRQAREDCLNFLAASGNLIAQALDAPGYSANRLGVDFWLTRCGHGAGFWDRAELEIAPCCAPVIRDRDGKVRQFEGRRNGLLGDYLTAIAYGENGYISPFAYPTLSAYRGWLSFD